jgi:apolipoprotein D and lipocalin family protein
MVSALHRKCDPMQSVAAFVAPSRARALCSRLLTALALLALPGCYDGAPPPDVAKSFDLLQFQGKWFEIAKLPRPTQTDCAGTVATYAVRADGLVDMTSTCHVGALDGPLKTMTATAKVPDANVPAKLALDVGGFYGDYWVLEVGATYDYAVVGVPSREYLWILSRTPTLVATTLHGIVDRARVQKFDVDLLELTKQL